MSQNKYRKFLKDWIVPILIAMFLAILINKFLVFKVKIPSESMAPTLNIGDRLFAHRVYNLEKLYRGDLIIFYYSPKDQLYIKRLIGLPGDKVVIKNGEITVNGEILTEDYVKYDMDFNGEFEVPSGQYFLLGDNRANSSDSRLWDYPYIDSNDIKGKAFLKVYPFSEIGLIE